MKHSKYIEMRDSKRISEWAYNRLPKIDDKEYGYLKSVLSLRKMFYVFFVLLIAAVILFWKLPPLIDLLRYFFYAVFAILAILSFVGFIGGFFDGAKDENDTTKNREDPFVVFNAQLCKLKEALKISEELVLTARKPDLVRHAEISLSDLAFEIVSTQVKQKELSDQIKTLQGEGNEQEESEKQLELTILNVEIESMRSEFSRKHELLKELDIAGFSSTKEYYTAAEAKLKTIQAKAAEKTAHKRVMAGLPVILKCTSCNIEYENNARYCKMCGKSLVGGNLDVAG
jgi:hypothetical protein